MEGDCKIIYPNKRISISIHTLRMEGDQEHKPLRERVEISIHTLRMEGDAGDVVVLTRLLLFQSTPSAWRVTHGGAGMGDHEPISIHTLRMEGDLQGFQVVTQRRFISIHTLRMEGDPFRRSWAPRWIYFNPHPPHGG